MLNSLVRTARKLTNTFGVAAAVAIMTASAPALAASINATGGLNQVEYPAGKLMIQYLGVNYEARLTPGCGLPANTPDILKAWTSLAQASLLSGKTMTIYYSDCGGVHMISDLVLVK